MIFFILL
jgi:hypothetical protein